MSENTFRIIFIVVPVIAVISMFFPYQRFNIAINTCWYTSSVTDKGG